MQETTASSENISVKVQSKHSVEENTCMTSFKQKMYVSHVPDSWAWETDALNVSWEGLVSYVFCPVALIPLVIQQMTTYRCRIMIAPGWPQMSWFRDLVKLSTKLLLRLPL